MKKQGNYNNIGYNKHNGPVPNGPLTPKQGDMEAQGLNTHVKAPKTSGNLTPKTGNKEAQGLNKK